MALVKIGMEQVCEEDPAVIQQRAVRYQFKHESVVLNYFIDRELMLKALINITIHFHPLNKVLMSLILYNGSCYCCL